MNLKTNTKLFNPVEKNLYIDFIVDAQNPILSQTDKLKIIIETAINQTGAQIVKGVCNKFNHREQVLHIF